MRHPTEGTLRQLVDEPAGVADSDREHVAACPQCLDALAAAREDATLVAAALATEVDVDVDAAWRRLTAAAPAAGPGTMPRARRPRALLRRPLVAGLAAAVVLSGAGVAAATGWIEIFATEEIAPVRLTAADLTTVPDLEDYGDFVVTREANVRGVRDAAAAASATGLDVPEVTELPRGVTGEPVYQVGGRASAVFTFSGETSPTPPAGLEGSRVRLVAGPGVAQVWAQPSGVPRLIVGRAIAPKAFSSGVSFETARDHLLSLPGFPDDVAAQLRTFNADGSTLPLPVPAHRFTTSPAQVNGVPATVLAARDKTIAAVVWVDDGVVTAVAGSLDADEVLTVAQELR